MFIDQAKIHVQAGNGGNGCVSFRREKFVPHGGPDGGDGGNAGHIYLRSTSKKNTLLDFRYRRLFKSDRGQHGKGGNQTGRSTEDLYIDVPIGTVIYDAETGEQLADLEHQGAVYLAARGGHGGKGNQHFATPRDQAPAFAKDGEPGEERHLRLELKLLADVGLIGLPNAGKSTLLSKISAAKPKIGSYPFTTLKPLLGSVSLDEETAIVVADIPGLIEGAAEGHGLGLDFLRHIERTRVLLHLIDVSGEPEDDPADRYKMIMKELKNYGKGIVDKPQVIVATKLDAVDEERFGRLKEFAEKKKVPLVAISAVTGQGLDELVNLLRQIVAK